jgi:hypothetical protein
MKKIQIKKLSLKKATISNMQQSRIKGGISAYCTNTPTGCQLTGQANCSALLTCINGCPSTQFIDCSMGGTCYTCNTTGGGGDDSLRVRICLAVE